MAKFLASESPAPSRVAVVPPCQAKQAHGNRKVERKTYQAVLHEDLQEGVVRRIGNRTVAFDAACDFGRHLVDAPSENGFLDGHFPSGVVDGHPKIDRALFFGAIEQRTFTLRCCQSE